MSPKKYIASVPFVPHSSYSATNALYKSIKTTLLTPRRTRYANMIWGDFRNSLIVFAKLFIIYILLSAIGSSLVLIRVYDKYEFTSIEIPYGNLRFCKVGGSFICFGSCFCSTRYQSLYFHFPISHNGHNNLHTSASVQHPDGLVYPQPCLSRVKSLSLFIFYCIKTNLLIYVFFQFD